jgi:large subunit ribosomal protein L28
MARICVVCDKKPHIVNSVSNANNKVKHWNYPNVHKMRFTLKGDNKNCVQRGAVCTSCVKANKVKKVI